MVQGTTIHVHMTDSYDSYPLSSHNESFLPSTPSRLDAVSVSYESHPSAFPLQNTQLRPVPILPYFELIRRYSTLYHTISYYLEILELQMHCVFDPCFSLLILSAAASDVCFRLGLSPQRQPHPVNHLSYDLLPAVG